MILIRMESDSALPASAYQTASAINALTNLGGSAVRLFSAKEKHVLVRTNANDVSMMTKIWEQGETTS